MTQVDAATREAYLGTDYRILLVPEVVLRIGEPSEALVGLHRLHHVTCSAFITACNPRSKRLAQDVNERRQQALAAALAQLGCSALGGIGSHPSNGWPPEPSFWVPGLERAAAVQLAARFDQNALVWSDADAVPQLLLL